MTAFLILLVSIVIGALVSRFGYKRGTGKLARRSAGVVAGFLAFSVLAVAVDPSAGDDKSVLGPQKEALMAASVATVEPAPDPLLSETADEFTRDLGNRMGRTITGKIEPGSVNDVFTAHISHHVSLTAPVDKTSKRLRYVVLLVGNATQPGQLKKDLDNVRMALDSAAPDAGGFESAMDSLRDEFQVFGNSPKRQVGRYQVTLDFPTPETIMVTMGPHRAEAPPKPEDRSNMAYIQCEDAVKQRLKSPSTADFPYFADTALRNAHNSNSYVIGGHVDAQNGFGATIRADWICQIAYSGSGEDTDPSNWKIFDVAMQSR